MAPAIWKRSGCSWGTRRSSLRRNFYVLPKSPTQSQFLAPSISDAVGGYQGAVAPFHSITSSARASSIGGTLRPRSGFGAARQAHREHRTLAGLAGHGHVAAHHAREFARDGKAKAGSAEVLRGRGIGLAELLEQLCL